MSFLDYFSSQSVDYAAFRPVYPDTLFAWLADQCDGSSLAVDCATGNGQAARGLAPYFRSIVALDPSASQLHEAHSANNVKYVRSTAELVPVRTGTVDVVTVAQAIHWFDLDAFFREARRVLRPAGVVALWAYGLPRIAPQVDELLDDHYSRVLGAYWPPQRRYVDTRYETLAIPVNEIPTPSFEMITRVELESVVGYVRSWSATRRYLSEKGIDPFVQRLAELKEAWGPGGIRRARWPMFVRVGRF